MWSFDSFTHSHSQALFLLTAAVFSFFFFFFFLFLPPFTFDRFFLFPLPLLLPVSVRERIQLYVFCAVDCGRRLQNQLGRQSRRGTGDGEAFFLSLLKCFSCADSIRAAFVLRGIWGLILAPREMICVC